MSASRIRTAAGTAIVGFGLAATIGLAGPSSAQIASPDLIGLTKANTIVRFAPGAPGTILATVPVTGLQAEDTLTGIDNRPATGAIVGIAEDGTIYTIDPASGAATVLSDPDGVVSADPGGVDFNPVPNALRVITGTNQNFRVANTGGDLATNNVDGTIAYYAGDPATDPATPSDGNEELTPVIAGAAYTNSAIGAPAPTTTALFVIDSTGDFLARQGMGMAISPNTGKLFTIGALGVDTGPNVGFDIYSPNADGSGGIAYAVLDIGGNPVLHTIDLATGAATAVGAVDSADIIGLTVTPALPAQATTTTTLGDTSTTAGSPTSVGTSPTTAGQTTGTLPETGPRETTGGMLGLSLVAAGGIALVVANRLRRQVS